MNLPSLAGTIERRLLVNYRADPDLVRAHLPDGFTPDLAGGHAIVGICLLQVRIRPAILPRRVGLRSFNGAHRYAVIDPHGRPAVYIPRRDTNSAVVALVGGRLFPGSHHRARITAIEFDEQITVALDSGDDEVHVVVTGRPTDRLPSGSVFTSPAAASAFFERADTGYSDSGRPGSTTSDRLDTLALETTNWSATPFAIVHAESSYFDDPERFPAGSISLDHALVMRNIHHIWHPGPRLTPRADTAGSEPVPSTGRSGGTRQPGR